MRSIRRIAPLLLAVTFAACACSPSSSSPSAPPSPAPTADPGDIEGIVVTFLVAGEEEYRIQLTDPADIDIARRLLAGEEAPAIPNGIVVRGEPGVNVGYSWHIDPASVEFADVTVEVCDGRPSDVERNVITSDRYCPWDAKVIEIDE